MFDLRINPRVFRDWRHCLAFGFGSGLARYAPGTFGTLVAEQAGAKIIADGEGLIVPTTVIAATKQFIAREPALLDRYLAVHRASLAFIRDQPDQALALGAEEQKISVADAKRMLAWYDFSPVITDADIKNLEADQRFMQEAGMLQAGIDIGRDLILPMARG